MEEITSRKGKRSVIEIVGQLYYDNSGNGSYDEWVGVEDECHSLTFRQDGVKWLESEGWDMINPPKRVKLIVEIVEMEK